MPSTQNCQVTLPPANYFRLNEQTGGKVNTMLNIAQKYPSIKLPKG